MDDISEKTLLALLGEPVEAVRERFPAAPAWLERLASAFSSPVAEMPHGRELGGFLSLAEPLIAGAIGRLRAGIETLVRRYPEPPFDPSNVPDLLFAEVPHQVFLRASRTLALELNVARLEESLKGETPEERFQDFVARLRDREVAGALLREYPILARQLVTHLDQWVAFGVEFLERLCADWSDIRTTFRPEEEMGRLVEVQGGAGDSHREGRSVLVLKFHSGSRLVYKPRPMAVDLHFQELLAWLNGRGAELAFRALKVLDRGTHGWVEFVEAATCASEEEVLRFYRRQGGYLALLYALQATDFHFENLIASGEHPVLIDLESLFHPRLPGADLGESERLADSAMARSVLRIGLLPQRTGANEETEGIDISGLASAKDQLTPRGVPAWEGESTDEMRFSRKRMPIPGRKNRPTRNDADVELLDYAGEIVTGFTSVYRLLWKEREELLSSDGPLTRFADDEVRALLRPTRTYGLLLEESFHPDLLRDGLDRDRFFDRLWIGVDSQPYLPRIIPAEREDLHRGDLPLFWTRPGSTDLWSSSNRRIPDFFPESGLDVVRGMVESFDERDLAQQVWFIEASLSTLASDTDRSKWKTYPIQEGEKRATPEALLAAARAVGDKLEALSLRGSDGALWIGLSLLDGRRWALLPLGTDLYSGLPGVCLFLAYLGAVSRESRYTELARAATSSLRRQIERNRTALDSIGAFSGWGGILYCLTHLGALWGEAALLEEAERAAERARDLISEDQDLDLVAGAAGCLGGLICLQRVSPSDRVLSIAIRCADHLVARARRMPRGIAWSTPIPARQPLCGLSHGASGMAWALLETAAITGEERFRAAALSAIAYERALFRPEVGNWPDLRVEVPDGTYLSTWCHGAPGIGLARLSFLRHADDRDTRAEVDASLATTLALGFGLNHSLCHGDLGNLDLLLQASRQLDDPEWADRVARLGSAILASIEERGWLCGNPLGAESPGLMTGLAGIGYGLLRLAAPERVPSILTLAPPASAA